MTRQEQQKQWEQILSKYGYLDDYNYLLAELKDQSDAVRKRLSLPHDINKLLIEIPICTDTAAKQLVNTNMHILFFNVVITKIWQCIADLNKEDSSITLANLCLAGDAHWNMDITCTEFKNYIPPCTGRFSLDIFGDTPEAKSWSRDNFRQYGNLSILLKFWAYEGDSYYAGVQTADGQVRIDYILTLDQLTKDRFYSIIRDAAKAWTV